MRRRRPLFLFCLAVLGIALAAKLTLQYADLTIPALLSVSREVARLPPDAYSYTWQSNEVFLHYISHPQPQVLQRNITTGAETDVTRSLQQHTGQRFVPLISPDRKKALWMTHGDKGTTVSSTSLESSAPILTTAVDQPPCFVNSEPIWMPDSRRWVVLLECAGELVAIVGEEGHTQPIRRIKIGHPQGAYNVYIPRPLRLLGVTQAGHVLATPVGTDRVRNPDATRHIDFFEFSVDGPDPHLHEWTIDMPKAETYHIFHGALQNDEEIEISPQGDRLAWLLHRKIETPMQEWLSRRFPGRTPAPRLCSELRITNLDGTGEKILGRVEVQEKPHTVSEERPLEIRWLPDGQHISFVQKSLLWIVAAQP